MIESFSQQNKVERRVFIKGLGYVSLSLIFSTMLGGCEGVLDQIKNRPVRRRLRTGSSDVDDVIAIYKDAVSQMKALPNSDPRSWVAQSEIHGTVTGGFNFCQHDTDHFFSWHRAYLLYFERICQELTGEKDFGLPYWNWNQDPVMHPGFTDTSSPLFHPRNNTSVENVDAFNDDSLNNIFNDNNFFTFSSQIEGTPHNTAHGVIGGDMRTGGSPLDPIFWAHHCMVDYCWAKWNIELENDNTNDPDWINTSWEHFVDENGEPITSTARATILMPFLSYRYENSTIGDFGSTRELTDLSAGELRAVENRLRQGADIRFDIKQRIPLVQGTSIFMEKPFSAETNVTAADFSALVESDQRSEQIFVRINYAEVPPENDFFVRVFINLPDANAETSTDSINYAGSFAFFGTQTGNPSSHNPKTDFLVNVTGTLQALRDQEQLSPNTPLTIQLVTVPVTGQSLRSAMEISLEEIEFIVTPVIVPSQPVN